MCKNCKREHGLENHPSCDRSGRNGASTEERSAAVERKRNKKTEKVREMKRELAGTMKTRARNKENTSQQRGEKERRVTLLQTWGVTALDLRENERVPRSRKVASGLGRGCSGRENGTTYDVWPIRNLHQ